jgi:4-hydroxythreonine-4-phosphate dehydrogenase
MKPIIAITGGDPNGIGPEVALKAVMSRTALRVCNAVLVGPWEVFRFYARKFNVSITSLTVVEPDVSDSIRISPGKLSPLAGRLALGSLTKAVHLTQEGLAAAIVTGPVSKRALHLGGSGFPGQTEILKDLTGSPRVAMMLVSRLMRIGLVTAHLPLKQVAPALSRQLLTEKILTFHEALRSDWRITGPHCAVLALNPHAGESGDLGIEDETTVKPVLRKLRRRGLELDGPFPADAFFGKYKPGNYDAIIAMYHDQGLIPLKMSSFGKAVNVSVGLPIVRTSPDHGTAFDIAGKGIADPGSMIEAIKLAVTIVRNRSRRSALRS